MLPLPVSIEYRDGYFVYASSSYLPLSESEMENAAPSAWKERGIHAGSGVESQGGPWGSTTHGPPLPAYHPPATIKFFFRWAPPYQNPGSPTDFLRKRNRAMFEKNIFFIFPTFFLDKIDFNLDKIDFNLDKENFFFSFFIKFDVW